MSWDVELVDPVSKETLMCEAPHYIRGGNYVQGGTTELWLNITYNYGRIYRRPDVFGEEHGLNILNGKTAAETIPMLKNAIANLGDDVSPDYWEPTEGNAKRVLCSLLAFAQMRPDGIWNIG